MKHAHHRFDIDTPGKDSHAHRTAGAQQVLVASSQRWALLTEHRGAPEPPLAELLRQFAPVDLVIVEGFKQAAHPKIEVRRTANAKPWLHPEDPRIVAVASDTAPPGGLPWAELNDIERIADFALHHAMPWPG